MSSTELRGKVVAITGAARGIGLATAGTLARRGARVAIGDLDASRAQHAAGRIGGDAIGLPLDVTDAQGYATYLEHVEHAFGPLDILINNAGIQHVGLFADEADAATAAQMAVNVGGVIIGTKLALARMVPRQSGHIVNLASVSGKIASPGGTTYAATKAAVVGLSESLRAELRGTGVEVTTIMPAMIATEMTDGLAVARSVQKVPPQAVADAIVRALERHRSGDVYVPRYVGALIAARAIMPARLRDIAQRVTGADDVLMRVDRNARAAYEARIEATES